MEFDLKPSKTSLSSAEETSDENLEQTTEQEVDQIQFDLSPSKTSKQSKGEELSSIPYAGPAVRGGASGFLGISGDLYSLIEGAADSTFDNTFGRLLSGSPEESKKIREESNKNLSLRFGKERKRVPGITEFKEGIDFLTGNKLQPGTEGERMAGKGSEFLGASMVPFGREAKMLSPVEAIGSFAGGAAVQKAEESGVGPLGQLGIGMGSTLLSQAGAKKSYDAFKALKDGEWKNYLREPSRMGAHLPGLKVKPNSEISEIIKAAESEGITLPLSAMTERPITKQIENITSKMTGGRGEYKNLFNKTNKEFVDSYQKNLDKISINKFAEKFEAGQAAQEGLKEARNLVSDRVRQQYQQHIEMLPQGASVSDNGIRNTAKKMSDQLSESLLPSAEETATKGEFNELLKNLEGISLKEGSILGANGKSILLEEGQIPIKNLVATDRSLSDLINYEKQGGSKKLLINAQNQVRKSLEDYSKTSPQAKDWYKSYQTAKSGHKDLAQRFRNNIIDSSLKNERPEYILNHMGTKSGIKKVGDALSETPEGTELFNSLKRFKLEEMIGKKLINASTGDVKYQAGASALADPKTQEVLKELMGDKNHISFKNLQKVSSGIQKGFKDFINPSKTAEVGLANATGYGAISSIITGAATWNPALVATGTGVIVAPWVTAKLLTSEGFLKESAKLAKAGQQGNKDNFSLALQGLIPIIQDVMTEASEFVEYEGEDEANQEMKQFKLSKPGQ